MVVCFDESKINPDILGIVTMSHGPLAKAVLESSAVILGNEIENSAAFCLDADDDPMKYAKIATEAISKFSKGCLIFLDLQGGSPYNQLMLHSRKERKIPWAIAGMSLPMIITASTMRESGMDADELMEMIIEESRNSILNVKKLMEEMCK